MATCRDQIETSLRRLAILGEGQTPSAEQAADGLTALNGLLDQWKLERLQIYSITRSTWTIVSGTSTYTLGLTGTINIARPAIVQTIRFQDTSQSPVLELPLDRLTDEAYSRIALKGETSPYPTAFWLNNTYPLSTVFLWPVPTSTTLQGVIYWPTAVEEFASINDTFNLPPGYRRMVSTALAMELAQQYRIEPTQDLRSQASESMKVLKRSNVRMADMTIEPAALGRAAGYIYNVFSDMP